MPEPHNGQCPDDLLFILTERIPDRADDRGIQPDILLRLLGLTYRLTLRTLLTPRGILTGRRLLDSIDLSNDLRSRYLCRLWRRRRLRLTAITLWPLTHRRGRRGRRHDLGRRGLTCRRGGLTGLRHHRVRGTCGVTCGRLTACWLIGCGALPVP